MQFFEIRARIQTLRIAQLWFLNEFIIIPGSSSGRTDDSGSSNGGSNPSPGVFKALVNFENSRDGESSHQKIFSCRSKILGSTPDRKKGRLITKSFARLV